MKCFGEQSKYKKKKVRNKKTKLSKEEIINQAFRYHSQGNISAAAKSYQSFINQGFQDQRVFLNYGVILKNLGKLKEAELSYRKAIDIKPDFLNAHFYLGNVLKDFGKFQEAGLSYRKAIDIKPDYVNAHYNLGNVFRDLGKYQEAELSYRKAIDIKPDYVEAYSNLGNVFRDLGKYQEAESLYRKAIELNPNYSKAYYSISLLKYSDKNKIWQDQLFSKNILKNNSRKDQIDIYFARANILHKEKNYKESSRYLQLANNLKLAMNPSTYKTQRLIKKTKFLLFESNQENINKKEIKNSSESIFIVGMPRCGSTLVESIISLKNNVYDLGEINILGESFQEYKKSNEDLNLAELYWEKVNNITDLNITTNKWLYNYQYAGIIARQIPNSKIIYCYRNPLDNILSIYRAHFAQGNEYSSSIVDCTNVYLNQDKVMREYKNRFKSKIYDLNYDKLVRNPKKEIKSLMSWLSWKWDDSYLKPHLNQRAVSTRSNVEIRSPINSKSVDGWKNYKDMLKPAIEILSKQKKI